MDNDKMKNDMDDFYKKCIDNYSKSQSKNTDNEIKNTEIETQTESENYNADIDQPIDNDLTDDEISKDNAQINNDDLTVAVNNVSKKRKKKKKKSHHISVSIILVTLILSVSAILAMAVITFSGDVLGMSGSSTLHPVNIPEGASNKKIAQILKDDGIIEFPNLFLNFCKLSDPNAVFQPGDFHGLSASMSYKDIIKELKKSKPKEVIEIMFQEGITLNAAAKKLQEKGICDAEAFIKAFNEKDVAKLDFDNLVSSNPLKFNKMEGYLFPDTYEFYADCDPEYVAEVIKLNFNKKVYNVYYSEMQKQGLDLDEVITLASIVQSEAPTKVNMEKVASVYWNRLNNSNRFPKLQSCPTRDYVTNVIKPNIKLGNDKMYDAYNTYKCSGLPVGAISNPGIEAIEAVLKPAKTDYYFFCTNLKTKEFFYAKTDKEHEANIKKAGLNNKDAMGVG